MNGSDVTLTCNHNFSNVSYEWEKYVDGGSYILVDITQTLTFLPFVFGNESVYCCTVGVSGEVFPSLPYTLYSECISSHNTLYLTLSICLSLSLQFLLKGV